MRGLKPPFSPSGRSELRATEAVLVSDYLQSRFFLTVIPIIYVLPHTPLLFLVFSPSLGCCEISLGQGILIIGYPGTHFTTLVPVLTPLLVTLCTVSYVTSPWTIVTGPNHRPHPSFFHCRYRGQYFQNAELSGKPWHQQVRSVNFAKVLRTKKSHLLERAIIIGKDALGDIQIIIFRLTKGMHVSFNPHPLFPLD